MRHEVVTPLPERMALHTAGQITWPEPALKKNCATCRFLDKNDSANPDKARCGLVQAHGGPKSKGVLFNFMDAIACPEHQE